MKKLTILSILFISLAFVTPMQVSAATNAGVKPSSFFYFFDTTFEKVGLFFTFNSEKKAQKALEYADERLAEAEESANENKPKDVEKAMEGYKKEISFATEKSKEIKDETKAGALLNTVSESTAKHQEVLESVLEKVPEEAKQAILNAIEVSKRGQEEAQKQISDLKKEVVRLKQELVEMKEKLENKDEEVKEDVEIKENDNNEEIGKLKKKIEELKQEVKQPTSQELKTENKEEVSEIKKDESKSTIPPVILNNDLSDTIIPQNETLIDVEVTQPYVNFTRPAEAPSPIQLRRLMAMCSLSDELATTCNTQTFISWYFTNIIFRTAVDDLLIKAEQKLSEQKAQSELAQQRYSLYLQTINQSAIPSTARYETYSLPLYSGGLKLESPQLNAPIKWNIQWTGDGGGFIESPSGTNYFQCLTGRCFSL